MTRTELVDALQAAHPEPGDAIYVERRGEDYSWRQCGLADGFPSPEGDAAPDVWIYSTGTWPKGDGDRVTAYIDDLLAEMESMAGGPDRCRWDADDPWPHMH